MLLEKSSKMVMIGDSITDAGRAQPVGEGLFDALGRGYISLADALLGTACPMRRMDEHCAIVKQAGDMVIARALLEAVRFRWQA